MAMPMFGDELVLSVGDRLGRFEIQRKLGQGGMGAVFLASDTLLNIEVAIKLLDPTLGTSEGFERFRREVLNARQVAHPGVCRIFDMHEEQGQYYISMEYVDGPTLLAVLQQRGVLSTGQAIPLIASICRAVSAAHDLDIVHRDLKPGNIIVRGSDRVSILDFGLSRASSMARITAAGIALGTVFYMPPEVITGENATKKSDIYALGVILYECVTGRLPFEGETVMEVQTAVVKGRLVPPRQFVPTISPGLEMVIKTALSVDPDERFASMQTFEQALLQAAMGGDGLADPSSQPTSAEPALAAGFQAEGVRTETDLIEASSAPTAAQPALAPEFATESVQSQPELRESVGRAAPSTPLSAGFSTEAVESYPEAPGRATRTPKSADHARGFATDSVESHPDLQELPVAPEMSALPPDLVESAQGGGRLKLVLIGLPLLLLGVIGVDALLGGRIGLVGLLRGGAVDAGGALVLAGGADAAVAAVDAGQAVVETPDAGVAAAVDSASAPDRAQPDRWRKPRKPDRQHKPPPVEGKSAQMRAKETYDEVKEARDAKGVSTGDSPAFDRALRAMKKARRRGNYAKLEKEAERALKALDKVRVNKAFVKRKLARLNERAGDLSEDWFVDLSVRINTALNDGDFVKASRLIAEGMRRLKKR